ncbi:Hsp20/alpha crystallin family protein [Rhodohalobacter sp. SW132]|uniref:Hsp20/alpha crystallin family protein n=1 Tax=Rhodohalobacter sp. SW132 TaxID=2293433 RepID=UPI000E25110F|nr:Hsp20/alpha crystallin family protein [Rhodohalobacter sp. SW132]REL33069.1 Hsp20/alpha crystallin family protein [Rhodohalobacter sp. SW132]
MTLIKYSRPGRNVAGKHFSDIMDEFFNEAVADRTSTFSPSINISETENNFNIEVEVPGMKKDDINVDIENNVLTVSGERKHETEEKERRFHRVETRYGSFSRTFQLPDHVDSENIEATYADGVLNIQLGKREEKLKKQIAIQ